jgi:hypothetical protein
MLLLVLRGLVLWSLKPQVLLLLVMLDCWELGVPEFHFCGHKYRETSINTVY